MDSSHGRQFINIRDLNTKPTGRKHTAGIDEATPNSQNNPTKFNGPQSAVKQSKQVGTFGSLWFLKKPLKVSIPEPSVTPSTLEAQSRDYPYQRCEDPGLPDVGNRQLRDLHERRRQRKESAARSRAASSVYTHVTAFPRLPSPLASRPPIPTGPSFPPPKSHVSRWIEASTISNPFSPATPHSVWCEGDQVETSPLVMREDDSEDTHSPQLNRQSEGWWNMNILTPLLDRSSAAFSRHSTRSRTSRTVRRQQRTEDVPPVPVLILPVGHDANPVSPGPRTGKSSKWTDLSDWDDEAQSDLEQSTISPILNPALFVDHREKSEGLLEEYTAGAETSETPQISVGADFASGSEKQRPIGVRSHHKQPLDGDKCGLEPETTGRSPLTSRITAHFESTDQSEEITEHPGPEDDHFQEEKSDPLVMPMDRTIRSVDSATVRSTLPPPYSPRRFMRSATRPADRAQPFHRAEDNRTETVTRPQRVAPVQSSVRLGPHSRIAELSNITDSRDRYSVPRQSGRSAPRRQGQVDHDLIVRHGFVEYQKTGQEKQRLDLEQSDMRTRRLGNLWRGRGCLSKRGWFGNGRPEDRRQKKRRCLGILAVVALLIIITIALSVTLTRRSATPDLTATDTPTALFTINGFPPIPTGVSSVVQPAKVSAVSACVFPDTLWSCALPKEKQRSPSGAVELPTIKFSISYINMSLNNDKTTPSPAVPALDEQIFLGRSTDGIQSDVKQGEETPFVMDLIASDYVATSEKGRSLVRRDFPDPTASVPPALTAADGQAEAANLFPNPLFSAQPIRLYDRGLISEHYGFYTYFDRSIFVKSVAPLSSNDSNSGPVPTDQNGGAALTEAKYRCTWAQTRYLIQIWTKVDQKSIISLPGTSANLSSTDSPAIKPITFPLPVSIALDRHGGDESKKLVFCYALDDRGRPIPDQKSISLENRGFGGTLVGGAHGSFNQTEGAVAPGGLGGIDGGTGGCSCKWQNFIS